MKHFTVLDKFEDFDLSQFVYHLNEESSLANLEIRYSEDDGRLLKVYLKTPVLELGRICSYKGHDYLDLQILDSYHSDFRDYLVTLDQYHLAQVESNQKIWGFDGSARQTILSQRFRNLLNFSSDTQHEYLLVEINQPKLFDQHDRRISVDDLRSGLKGRAILELEGLFSQPGPRIEDGQSDEAGPIFFTKLNLVQLKVRLPEIQDTKPEIKPEENPEELPAVKSEEVKPEIQAETKEEE